MLVSQYHHGGPVIAFQVENEYGAFNKDEKYMPYIKEVRTLCVLLHLYVSFSKLCFSGMHF